MHWRSAGTLVAMMLLAACGGHTAGTAPSNGPRFVVAILSDDPQGATEKTVFAPTATIYALFTLADVSKGTTIKSAWIREPNKEIDEDSLVTTTSDDRGYFVLRRPVGCAPPPGPCGSPLLTGAYRVDLFIGGRLVMVKHFRVEGSAGALSAPQSPGPSPIPPPLPTPMPSPAPAPSAPPAPLTPEANPTSPGPSPNLSSARIGPIVFARGVSSDGKPIDPARQFPLGIMQIYAIFELRGLKTNDVIGEVLYWGSDRPVDKKLTAMELFGGPTKEGPYPLTLYKSAPWPAGSYRLELSLNGTVMQKGTFEVVAKAGLGPIVFARDAAGDGTPIGAATQFPAGIKKISAVFHGEGLKANDVIGTVWYRGTERVAGQKFPAADFVGAPWIVIEQPFSSGLTPGSYRLELSLNGTVVQTGTFEVRPQ